MVNLQWLSQNATPLEINTSVLGNVNTALPNMILNANTVSLGFYGLGIMIAAFVYLLIRTNSPTGAMRMDVVRSLQVSSGFVFILGFIMNISGLISSYNHVLIFFTIFCVSTIWVYYLKRSNA